MEKILRIVTLTTALMFCSFFIYGQQLKTCTMENYVINSGEGPMSGKMTYTYYVDENGDRVRHGKMNITCQDTYEAIKPGYQTLKYKFSVKYEAAGTYKNGWLDGALTVKLTYTNVEDKPGTIVKTLIANYRNGVPHGSWNMTYVIRGETYDYVKINFNEGQLSGPFSYKIHNIFAWAGRNYDAQIVKGQLTNDGFLSGEWVVQTVQSTEKSFNFTPTGFYLKDLSEEDKECLKKFNYVITPEIMQKEHLIIEKKSINYLDHWGFLLDFIYQDHLFNLEIIGGDKTFGSNYKKQYMDRTWDDRVVKVKEQDMKEMSMETGYKSLIRFESKEVTDDQLAMIIRAQQVLDNTSTVDGRWAKNAIGCQNVIRFLNALVLSEDEQFQYFKERELKKKNYTYKLTVEQKDYVQSQIPIWEEQLQKAKEAEKKEIAMKAQRERISLAEKWLDMYVYNRDDKLTISEPSLEVWLSSKTDREPVSPDNKMVFNSFSLNGEQVQNTNVLKSVLTKKVLPFFPFKEYKIDSVSNIADTTWITCTISQRNMEPSGSSMHEKGDPKVWKTMVVVRGNMIDLDNSLDFSKVIKVRTKADDVEELISVTDSVHNVITGLDFPLLVNAYNNETTDLKNSMKRWGITTDEKLTKLQKLSKIQDAYLFFAKIEKQIDDYDKELMQETSSEFSDVAEWYSYLKKNYKTTSYSSDNIEDFKKSTDEYM